MNNSDNILGTYLDDIGKIPLLSKEEEKELAYRIKKWKQTILNPDDNENNSIIEQGKAARDKLISANYRLVVDLAKKFKTKSLELMDLIHEGVFGLMTAIDKFKPELGYAFSTYSYFWIKQSITRAIENQDNVIKVPSHAKEFVLRVSRAKIHLIQNSIEPTLENIANYLNEPEERIFEYLIMTQEVDFLDAKVGEDEETSFLDMYESESMSPHDYMLEEQQEETIEILIDLLNDNERFVLINRFGLYGEVEKTLEDIGVLIGVTRERVRQIEKKAIKKLTQHKNIILGV